MKKLMLVLVAALFVLCSCSKVEIKGDTATIYYSCNGKNIQAVMTDAEAAKTIEIFNGKKLYSKDPKCPFGADCTILIGGKFYHLAKDYCTIIKDEKSGQYFDITDEERAYIEKIFEKYGATFPCA